MEIAEGRAEIERCLASGDQRRALQLSGALLEAQPDRADVRVLHAAALMAGGDWLAASEHLQQCTNAPDPDVSYLAWARLALCRQKLEDRAGALSAYREALERRPGDFVQRLAYAESLASGGDREAALPEFFRAVRAAQDQGRWLGDASTPPHLRERVKRAMAAIDAWREALFSRLLERHEADFGADALRRVREALALYLGRIAVPAADPRQQPKFFRMPGLPASPYFDRALFPWYEALEASTAAIQRELRNVLEQDRPLTPFLGTQDAGVTGDYLGGDPGRIAWDAYFLYRHGRRYDDHLAACAGTDRALGAVPLTIVRDHAPEVLFSVLAPSTHIKPHHGVTNTRVVTHLPLLIPDGDCRLVVGGMEHAWREGRCVTFDDTFLHEAWNRSGELRVVLILDTWNPHMTREECIAVRDIVEAIGDFGAQAGATPQNMR
jgi:aspartate beta-hydroxylase